MRAELCNSMEAVDIRQQIELALLRLGEIQCGLLWGTLLWSTLLGGTLLGGRALY